MPRGLVHVAGSERCILSYRGCPSSQMILEIRIQRGGISIQGPTIWAVPGYLDDWLILAQSEAVSTSHKTLLISHLGCLGIRVNFAKSILSRSQRVSFLGTVIDSVQMTATVSAERATMIHHQAASFKELKELISARHCCKCCALIIRFLEGRYRPSVQSFPEKAGPYGSVFAGTLVGSASHATHPVLDET